MYKVTVDQKEIPMESEKLQDLDIIPIGDNQFHILQNGKTYQAKLLTADYNSKSLSLEINGNKYDLTIADQYDLLVKKMGLSTGGAQKIKNVKAPMPGLILDILVEPGQAISKGDQLLILEAMKMENVLKAEGDGVVKSVEVKKSAAVDKGQVLIEME